MWYWKVITECKAIGSDEATCLFSGELIIHIARYDIPVLFTHYFCMPSHVKNTKPPSSLHCKNNGYVELTKLQVGTNIEVHDLIVYISFSVKVFCS